VVDRARCLRRGSFAPPENERHHSVHALHEKDPARARHRAVEPLSTPRLRHELETALDRLAPTLEATKARARGTVTGVFVGAIDGDQASTVVTVDVVVNSTEVRGSTQQEVLSLGLVKVDGDWQVDKVTNLRGTGTTSAPTTP
jgi:hypothetical protein